jgi:hypothetical protein
MVNPFEQTPAEKEEYVLEMLQHGYGWNQIMKECHVSPNTISSVKKKFFGPSDGDASKNAGQISKETQCFNCFQQGKSLLATKIETDIPSSDVVEYHKKYQELLSRDHFNIAYNSVSGNIVPFLHLFDLMNGLGMTPADVAQLAGYGTKLPFLWNIHSKLYTNVQILDSQKRNMVFQLNCAQNDLERFKASLEYYYKECELKRNELLYLHSEIYKKTNIIETLTNDNRYVRIKEAAKRETKLLMQNSQVSFAVTLTATLEAIRRYPNNDMLISDIVTSRCYSPTSTQKPWLESHAPKLLQLMQNVQDEMAELIARKSINVLENRSESKPGTAA